MPQLGAGAAAQVNLARLKEAPVQRGIDVRYLARPGVRGHLAASVTNLAAAGAGYSTDKGFALPVSPE